MRETYKKYNRVLKRITAVILAVAMLPLSDIAQADIRGTLEKVYADEERNEIIQLTGEMDSTGNVSLKWESPDESSYQYKIYKNGEMIAETAELSYLDVDTEAGGEYIYEVIVYQSGSAEGNKAQGGLNEGGENQGGTAESEWTEYGTSNRIVIQMPEALVIDGDYTLDKNMSVYSLDIQSGCLDLNGFELKVCKDAQIDGKIKFSRGKLICNSDILFDEDASCSMRYEEDYLYVGGNFIDIPYRREEEICFEKGTFQIMGNFKVKYGMEFGSATSVKFWGQGKQIIDCRQRLGRVGLFNYSREGVEIVDRLEYSDYFALANCNISYIEREQKYVSGWTLTENQVIEDDFYINSGNLNLNGYTLTVRGDMEVIGGEINLNGGVLNVEGSMTLTGGDLNINHGRLSVKDEFHLGVQNIDTNEYINNGIIHMVNEDDSIEVGSSFYILSGEKSELYAGNIKIEGSMNVEGNLTIGNHVRAGWCRNDYGMLTVSGTLEVDSYGYGNECGIIMDRGRILCYGYFGAGGMVSPGYGLMMMHPEDYVCVYGGFSNGEFENEGYSIQSGIVELKGADNLIYAYGDSTIIFSGDTAQSASGVAANIEVRNSSIYGADISGISSERVTYYETPVSYKGIELKQGWTLTSDTVIDESVGISGGVLDLNGYTLTVKGSFCHFGGTIRLNGGRLNISGDYMMEEGNYEECSQLVMENSSDYMQVGGNFSVEEYRECRLSDGILEIGGDVTGEGLFCSEQNHKVLLSGNAKQNITIPRNSYFNILEIINHSDEGVMLSEEYTINELVRNECSIIYGFREGIFGWTLRKDEVYEGDLCLADDELNLNGHTLRVKGDFIQNGGTVNVNNGTLIVEGDYNVNCQNSTWINGNYTNCNVGNGSLIMDGSHSRIDIKGWLIMDIKTEAEWKLENGIMNIAGDIQLKSQPQINVSDDFMLCLNGTIKQEVSTQYTIHIKNVTFNNSSWVELPSYNFNVCGKIYSNGSAYVDNLCIDDTAVFMDDKFKGIIILNSDYVIEDNVTLCGRITGNHTLTVNGELNMDGFIETDTVINGTLSGRAFVYCSRLNVNGEINASSISLSEGQLILNHGTINVFGVNLQENAEIHMNHADDYIKTENFGYSSGCPADITDGIIEITENAELNNNFITSGNNKIILSGEKAQGISATGAPEIRELIINQPADTGAFLDINIQIKKMTDKNQNEKKSVTGYVLEQDTVIEEDFYLYGGYVDLNGHNLVVKGDFIQTKGKLVVHNGEIHVAGNYYTSNPESKKVEIPNKYIPNYTDTDERKGVIDVEGDIDLTGHSLSLSSGAIIVGGNIRNNEAAGGIEADTITFTGENISIDDNVFLSSWNLLFQCRRVELENELSIKYSLDTDGTVFSENGKIIIEHLSYVQTDSINANVVIPSDSKNTLNKDMMIQGDLTINGQMWLNTYTLTADNIDITNSVRIENGKLVSRNDMNIGYDENTEGQEDLKDDSRLIMQKTEGYVLVYGDFRMRSKNSHSGYLTAGTLEVKGDFIQTGHSESFRATGTHKTVLSRKTADGKTYEQNIHFKNPVYSGFQNLVLTRRQDSGYRFNKDINIICRTLAFDYDDAEPPAAIAGLKQTGAKETAITITYEEATDNMELFGYFIYRDGEKIADVKKSVLEYTDTGLEPDTEYTYEVFAYDDCDNAAEISPELKAKTAPDIQPPAVPESLSVVKRTGSAITLRWNSSADNVKVAGYELFRNGEKIADITGGTTYKDTELSENTVYEYCVKAYDTSGNRSDFCRSVKSYVAMPEIERMEPGDNSSIGGEQATVTLYVKDSGGSRNYHATLEYRKKGGTWNVLCDSLHIDSSYDAVILYADYKWDISSLSEGGEYDIRCTVYDEDGSSTDKTVTYLLDKEAPEKPQNVSISTDNGTNVITFDASVSADCAGYRIYRKDGENNVLTKYAEIAGQYAVKFTDTGVMPGKTYVYAVSAFDKFDNESSLTQSITVETEKDNKKPEITGITPNDKMVSGIVNVEVYATDNIGVESIKLWYRNEEDEKDTDNDIFLGEVHAENGKASFSFDTAELPDGAYIITAVAVDTSGNESDRNYTKRYETDNTGISKIELADCTCGSTSVQLRWKDVKETDFAYFAVERVIKQNTENYTAERIGTVSDTLGYNVTGLKPECTYYFQVVGYDKLGNRGIPSDIYEVTTAQDNIVPVINSILPIQSRYRDILFLSMQVSDNDAVDRGVFSYSLDGVNFETIAEVRADSNSTSANLTYNFDLTELPEGEVYIKFEAYDVSGNKNAMLKDGSDVVAKYIVDRTPPSVAENLSAAGETGYITLEWDKGEEDIASYTIIRAEEENGTYKTAADNYGSQNYYDTDIVPGKTYWYRIAAKDIAGNTGEYSQAVSAVAVPDTEKPEIKSMSPEQGSIVGENPAIRAFAVDNTGVAKITAEYKRADETDNVYRTFAEAEGSERSLMLNSVFPTGGLKEGDYVIRTYCEDTSGNMSDCYEITFTIDTTPPSEPEMECESGGYKVDIRLSGGKEEDFSHYRIYRAELLKGEYTCIATTKENKYEDRTVQPGIIYCYKAEAYDIRGNYSTSEVQTSYATDEDTEAPKAILSECITTLEGYEIALDGTASTDNVRITEYKWDMGNGDIITGAQPVYTYDSEGVYTVILTVKDAAGNSAKTSMAVQVLSNNGNGTAEVTVIDTVGTPLAYADVYMKYPDGNITTMKTDGMGKVQIAAAQGSYEVAAYANGYLPNDRTINISRYEEVKESIVLESGELIVGDLTVEKMSLQEMIDAGVNIADPANMNIFTFTVTVKLQQTPMPQEVVYVGGSSAFTGSGEGRELTGTWGSDGYNSDVGGGSYTPEVPKAKMIDAEEPIIAIISTTQTVSWLKEMYNVNLSILNAADSKYIIKDSMAELILPEGVSLAVTANGQSRFIDMGDIAGQQQKNASWVVRGDKTGTYKVEADFGGTLMPFGRKVNAHFEAEKEFEVSTGEGLHIIIYPEKEAYIDENYYIQFAVKNESSRNFYNFRTTLGAYSYENHREELFVNDTRNNETGKEEPEKGDTEKEEPEKGDTEKEEPEKGDTGKEETGKDETGEKEPEKNEPKVYTIPSGCTQIPVLQGGDQIHIPVLTPGETIYGTYYEKFDAPGERKKVYYKLIETLVSTMGNDITGVKISIEPIDAHVTKSIVNIVERKSFFGDPVDLSTGAFVDSIPVLSVNGVGELGFSLEYSSMLADKEGESGRGFYNNVDTHITEDGAVLTLYLASGISGTFVHEDTLQGRYQGTVSGSNIYLYNEPMTGTYVSLSSATKDYSLTKNSDGTYTMTTPAKDTYRYDTEGRVVLVTDDNGRETAFTYADGIQTVTETASGKRIHIHHDENGMVSRVTDDNGRSASFTYEEGFLTAYTNVLGETTTFTYDEAGRIRSEIDCGGVAYVTNTYDGQGRVICQSDADRTKPELQITYEETENVAGTITTVTTCDALGNRGVVVVDEKGRIIKNIDNNGGVTEAGYDSNGNETYEKDALGGTIFNEYDAQGRKIKVTDQSGSVTRFAYDGRDNLTAITDGEGKTSYYEYNERNLITKITDYNGNVTEYEYDGTQLIRQTVEGQGSRTYEYADGMLIKSTDYNGNATTYEYDGTGTLLRQTDAMGNTTSYTHDAMLRITSETNALGGTRTYTYDKYGNTVSETDELGRTTVHEYDITGTKTADIQPDGSLITYEHDAGGRVTKTIQPDGTHISCTYDAGGNLLSETNELGETITYEYDVLNQKTSETSSTGKTIRYGYYPNGKLYVTEYPDGTRELYTYDSNWRLIRKTDALNNSVTYRYDDMGRIAEERDALGGCIRYEYDSAGRMTAQTDKNGNRTAYTYDGNGNCLSKTEADGTVITYTYDSLNRLTGAATEGKTCKTITVSYEYDALSRLTAVTDEEGGVTRYEYDACGNLIQETDTLGNTTTYEYDINGNLTKTADALGNETTHEYSRTGLLLRSVEAAGTVEETTTAYQYDDAGRLLSVTDPSEGVVACTYDADGNVRTVTDANGGTTAYEYDEVGRMTKEINAIGSENRYTYNATGLLEQEINARGQDTEYTHDPLGRITQIKDEAGIISYEYDPNGNILTVTEKTTDKNGIKTTKTIHRTYDTRNRVTEYTDSNGKSVRYGYDELGNRVSVTYPGGEVVRYTYYASGRIKSVTDSSGRVTYYTYDSEGNLTATERPDGTRETNVYNAAGQVITRTDVRVSDGTILHEYHYEYDIRGNITQITGTGIDGITEAETDTAVQTSQAQAEAFAMTGANGMGSIYSDVATARTGTDTATQTSQAETFAMTGTEMEYDADNRLVKYNGVEVKYDADGNMTYGPVNGEMTELVYDCRNRLVRAGSVTYEYDAENTRTAVVTDSSRTEYVTDVESELSQVLTAHTTYTDRNKEDKNITYVYGNGLIYEYGSVGKESIQEGSGTEQDETEPILVHHYNNIGSTTKLTNELGEVVEKYSYGTYGELLSGDASKTAYLYNGMLGVATDENGLYYMRARYYNTDIKRFINRDVVKGSLSNSQSLNRYSYVQGNPVSLTDPFGLSPFSWKAFGHGLLNALGMIPYIGEVFDLANAAWYAKEGNYAMAALCTLAALPLVGNIAGGTLTMFKCAKAGKYVKAVTKVVSNAATFTVAAAGDVKSIKSIYNNIKDGKIFTKENLLNLAEIGLNTFTMMCSGKNMVSSGKELGGMLKNDMGNAWSKVKGGMKKYSLIGNNSGFVNMNAPVLGSESGSNVYYHVTTEENAKQIIESGVLKNGKWESYVFAWTQQPTKRQASIAGISSEAQTVIKFKTNASFVLDTGNIGKSISNIVVQTSEAQRLPISISDVEIVGFKKEWWEFWKK